jgi:hypothetical protein
VAREGCKQQEDEGKGCYVYVFIILDLSSAIQLSRLLKMGVAFKWNE